MKNGEPVGYKRLRVWEESHTLVLLLYKVTKNFPKDELFGLTSQIRRAAVSIPANIVEGFARASRKEFIQFLYIATGSLVEVEYYIHLAKDLGYIDEESNKLLLEQHHYVGVLLHKFLFSIKSQQ